jgi:hypothetical protein
MARGQRVGSGHLELHPGDLLRHRRESRAGAIVLLVLVVGAVGVRVGDGLRKLAKDELKLAKAGSNSGSRASSGTTAAIYRQASPVMLPIGTDRRPAELGGYPEFDLGAPTGLEPAARLLLRRHKRPSAAEAPLSEAKATGCPLFRWSIITMIVGLVGMVYDAIYNSMSQPALRAPQGLLASSSCCSM